MLDPVLADALAEFYARAWWRRELRDYFDLHHVDLGAVLPQVGAIGMMDVVEFADDRFDFSTGSSGRLSDRLITCLVFEALDEDEEPFDLVALPVGEPARPMTMFGRVGFLRPDLVTWPGSYTLGKVMLVHRHSLDWLRAGCAGTAIVHPKVAALEMLNVPGQLMAEDRRHAAELARIGRSVFDERMVIAPPQKMRVAA